MTSWRSSRNLCEVVSGKCHTAFSNNRLEATSNAMTKDEVSPKAYPVFRKQFHIPSRWEDDEEFNKIVRHEYLQDSTSKALTLVHTTFRKMGYMSNNDNDSMIHDYLHFMLMDLLTASSRPFIHEKEIPNLVTLKPLFGEFTPDLIVKSGGSLQKPTIIDIYTGKNAGEMDKKKAKYRGMMLVFDFRVITPTNFTTELKDVLSAEAINYLFKQFQFFLTEYHYWRACIKFEKLLKNDVQNHNIKLLPIPEKFAEQQSDFVQSLERKVAAILDDSGV
jgi:hypothetical protein